LEKTYLLTNIRTLHVTIQVVGVDSMVWNESGLPVSVLSKAWSKD
jgi:hypothetical protein